MRTLLVSTLLLVAAPVWAADALTDAAFARSASAAQADTMRYTVVPGEALVVALPETVRGREASYRVLRAPALSWLVDRSFFWRTLPTERGVMHILLERRIEGAAPDTLVLRVAIAA